MVTRITRFYTVYTSNTTRFNESTLNNGNIIVYTSGTVEFNTDVLNISGLARFDTNILNSSSNIAIFKEGTLNNNSREEFDVI